MSKQLLLTALMLAVLQTSFAQNTTPYWSLAGNSNASASSKFGTTNNIPLRLFTNNAERMRIDSIGRVLIGTTTARGKFTLQGNGTAPNSKWISLGTPVFASFGENGVGNGDHIMSLASSTYNARTVLLFRRSRGTLTSPIAVASNDFLGSLLASGYDGTNFQNPASVDFFADGAPSGGNVPARISFSTGVNSNTRTERLVVKSNGDININDSQLVLRRSDGFIGIGTSNPTVKLQVVGSTVIDGSTIVRSNLRAYAPNGAGVYGAITLGDQYSIGVQGINYGTGTGVYGYSTSSFGVRGYTNGAVDSFVTPVVSGVEGRCGGYGYGVSGYSRYGASIMGYSGGTYAGLFYGNVMAYGTYLSSDRKLKKNLSDIRTAMEVIGKLKPQVYEFRDDGVYGLMNLPKGKHFGLLAQDVEEILPDLVKQASFNTSILRESDVPVKLQDVENNAKAKGVSTEQQSKELAYGRIDYKAVNYTELIPIMIKGMQEQQVHIEEQRQENSDLRKEVAELKAMVAKLVQGSNTLSLSNASLGVANPNPSKGITTVSFNLPQETRAAYILVTDMKGSSIKQVNVSGAGAGQVRLNTASLAAGTYTYSLFVDGSKVDSKQLLIAR